MAELTTAEAARRLGITARAVTLLCRRGKIAGTKLGRDWFVSAKSVEKYAATPKPKGGRPRKEG